MNYLQAVDSFGGLRESLTPYLAPEALPSLVPVLLFVLAVSAVAAIALGDRLGIGVIRGWVWVTCLLLPMAYTLTATTWTGSFGCEVELFPGGAAAISGEALANVILTVPAGAAAMLFPVGARRLAALGSALTLPFLVEFAQMLSPPLGRGCQVSDVITNMVGVALGFCLAAGLWALWGSLRAVPGKGLPTAAGRAARERQSV